MSNKNTNSSLNTSNDNENINNDDIEVVNNQEEIQKEIGQLPLEIPAESNENPEIGSLAGRSLLEKLQNLNISTDANVTNTTSFTTTTIVSLVLSDLPNIAPHLLHNYSQINDPFVNITYPCMGDMTVSERPNLGGVLRSIMSVVAASSSLETVINELVPATASSLSIVTTPISETFFMQLATVPSLEMPIPRFSLKNLTDSSFPSYFGPRTIYTMAPSRNLDTNLVVSSTKFSQRNSEILQPRRHVLTTEATNIVLLRPPSFIPQDRRAVPRMIKGSPSRYGTEESQYEEDLTNITECQDNAFSREEEYIEKKDKKLTVCSNEHLNSKGLKKQCLPTKEIAQKSVTCVESEDSSSQFYKKDISKP